MHLKEWCPKGKQLLDWVSGPKVGYLGTLNFLPKR